MKIAIEAQRIFRKEKHGMDYVALETIRELQKIDKQNEYFILVSPGDDICLQESANVHIVTVNWPSYPLWEQIGLPLALRKIKPDLLNHIRRWIASAHPYTCRFGMEMLMTWFLDADFQPEYLELPAGVHSEEYYVRMMIAWFFRHRAGKAVGRFHSVFAAAAA